MQCADCKVLLVGVYYLLIVGISSLFHRQLRKMLNHYRNDISIEKVVVKLFVNFTWNTYDGVLSVVKMHETTF